MLSNMIASRTAMRRDIASIRLKGCHGIPAR
jgi:hypothetical protein